MTKVGFVTKSFTDGNAQRGIGFYAKRLLPELKKQAKNFDIEIYEIENSFQISNFTRKARQSRFQIIHYPYFDLFYHTLPIFKKTQTIVTIHDVIPLEFPDHYPPGLKGWLSLQLQKLALWSVDRVIADSYASVQAIRKYLLVPHEKLKLVYLAADKKFKPIKNIKKLLDIKKKYKLPKNFVLYVGDINWNKNIPNLVKACEQINYPLVIVGKQAAETEKMDLNHPQLQHLNNLDFKNVIRLGFIPDEDLVAIYNLASVYCQPSFAEGFGLPILEAMACGTPISCSRTHSLPEIAGDAASYFDPYNIEDMKQAIIKAQNALPATLRIARQTGNFSWEKTALDTLRVYQEIL